MVTASTQRLLTIAGSVGKQGENQFDDSLAVQHALNGHIHHGQLMGAMTPIPTDGAGGSEATVNAIRAFQREVIGMNKPDGRVDPPAAPGRVGKTLQFLRRKPDKVLNDDEMLDIVADRLNERVGSINPDVWDYAMNSLVDHFDHRRLERHHMLMIVDYTIPMNRRRLWVFDLRQPKQLMHTYVLHGWKSGGAIKADGTVGQMTFGNGNFRTSVGGYATGRRLKTPAGKPWKYEHFPETHTPPTGKYGDGVYLHGLDPTNDRAYAREVIIHAGFAFDDDGTAEKFSAGCIVTNPLDNARICDWMHGGAFVFVFGGVRHMHNY